MVLESIVDPLVAERKPWMLFFLGIVFNSVAIIVSLKIFYDQASILMVFLTVLACAHLMYQTVKKEEKKDTEIDSEKTLLKEHSKTLVYLMMLFLGVALSCSVWYMALPSQISSDLFNLQSRTIMQVNTQITGESIAGIGIFSKIFINNITVLFYCIISGIIYGLGAIFILTWNASVVGVAIANFFRDKMSIYAGAAGLAKAAAYLHVAPWSILRYMFHGIPEMLSYFIGGLAGGIMSIAFIKGDLSKKFGEKIFFDIADLIILSIVILIIAAILEVYVTPVLF